MPLPSFGRSRNTGGKTESPPRRGGRSAPPSAETGGDDPELSSYLAALAPERDVESTGSGRRFGEAQVYQLRLSLAAGQQLKELASELGTSPQALAQEWILDRLAGEYGTPMGARAPSGDRSADEPATDELYLDQHQWPGEPEPGRYR